MCVHRGPSIYPTGACAKVESGDLPQLEIKRDDLEHITPLVSWNCQVDRL